MRCANLRQTLLTFLLAANLAAGVPLLAAGGQDIPPAEYAARRAAVLQQMPDSSVAVFRAPAIKTRSNDVEYEYRQSSNLLYLTGLNESQVALILVKYSDEANEAVLFIPKANPARGVWGDQPLSAEAVKAALDLKSVEYFDAFEDKLKDMLPGKKVLFYSFDPDFIYEPLGEHKVFISREVKKALRRKYPGLRVKSPSKMLAKLRQVKSPAELKLMQRAIDITAKAQMEAMRAARPGLFEYQIEALIEFVFKREGAEYPAFPSIIGSGPNSTVLHHWRNRRKVRDGDLIVMDVGAEYHGYSADITRTIPANGKFSEKQREIYQIVLRAQKAAIDAVAPGVPFRKIHQVARKIIEDAGYGKYFTHGTSHFLGLDTHDVGERGTLQPGMVLTVEPGIYIRAGSEVDKAYWNIGVRIEDDVLVTEDGHKVLSGRVPREIEEIEALMRQESRLSRM